MFVGTWWSLMPPIVAIALALLTKEVYLSLFAGCALGALLAAEFHPWIAFDTLFNTMIFLCQVGTKKILRIYKPFIGGQPPVNGLHVN